MKRSKLYAFIIGDSRLQQTYGCLVKNSKNPKFILNASVFLAAKAYDM